MTNKETGGPAFGAHPESANWHPSWQGMTLRDYFAAQSLHSFNVLDIDDERDLTEQMAVFAYRLADAMLKAREQ